MFEVKKIEGKARFKEELVSSREEADSLAKKHSKESTIVVFENKREIFRYKNGQLYK